MPLPLADPLTFTVLAAIFGLVVGSFLNVVIYRLPKMLAADWARQCAELQAQEAGTAPPLDGAAKFNLAQPRSNCPHCGKAIGPLENIPLLSWLLLRGRCAACQAPISPRYPLIEAASAILAAAVAWRFGPGSAALGAMLFVFALLTLAAIDYDCQLLPDDITLPLLWLGLAFNLGATYVALVDAVIGAMAGYLALWLVYWGFKLATGKEGMGYGDFKLNAAIGAWLGWQALPGVILFAALIGALVGVVLIALAGRSRSQPLAFGPCLAIAGVITLFTGNFMLRL